MIILLKQSHPQQVVLEILQPLAGSDVAGPDVAGGGQQHPESLVLVALALNIWQKVRKSISSMACPISAASMPSMSAVSSNSSLRVEISACLLMVPLPSS
jgi:hypothetical protein